MGLDIKAALTDGSHSDGWIRDSLDGRTYGGGDTGAGRLSAKIDVTPQITWVGRVD